MRNAILTLSLETTDEYVIEDVMEKICLRKKSIRMKNSGHLDICELIMEKIENKNPRVIHVGTPLDLAARHGHLKICKLIQCYLNKYDGKHLVNNHQFNWK